MSAELTHAVEQRLSRAFSADDAAEARRLLREDCPADVTAQDTLLDRVQIAALKLSGGTLEGLVDAIVLAQTDWRDLLVATDFAEDVHAHESWWPD